MYCCRCGSEIKENVKFCSNCGNAISYEDLKENCRDSKVSQTDDQLGKQGLYYTICGVGGLVLAICSIFLNNPYLIILMWIISVILSVIALIKRCKLKVIPILAVVLIAVLCGFIVMDTIESGENRLTRLMDSAKFESYDEANKNIYEYAGIRFYIPDYYQKEDNVFSYNGVIISFNESNGSISADMFYDAEEIDKMDNKVDELSKKFPSGELQSKSNVEIAGCDAREYQYLIADSDEEATEIFLIISNAVKNKKLLVTYVAEKDDGTRLNDYNSILKSATIVDDITDNSTESKNEEVDPNLKSFLDEYELFIDEYVEFMKKYYKNPTDAALLTEYTDVLQKYNLFTEKLEKYDTEDMSTADLSYYIEVTSRCSQKLLQVTDDQ